MSPAVRKQATHPPDFADLYDQVVGEGFHGYWWTGFERLVDTYQITFDSVCDVACGTGETVRRMAERGVARLYGSDISTGMIRVAQAKCAETGATFTVQPMQQLTTPAPVDLIVCAYDSLNRLECLDDLAQTFQRFHDALTPGGHVVCDLATLNHLENDWGSGVIHVADEAVGSVWRTRWDAGKQTLSVDLTLSTINRSGGVRQVTEQVVIHGYRQVDIERAIAQAGLTLLEVRDLIPWTAGTERGARLFYLLQRPA